MSYYITLFSRVIFTKSIILLILLPISKKDKWYEIIGMSVFLPLAIIPSSYLYFYYLLPELLNLRLILFGNFNTMLGIVKNWLVTLKLIAINIIYLKLSYLEE